MVITWVHVRLKAKAPLHLQAAVPAEVAHVPERVGLAFEEGDDDTAAWGEWGGGGGARGCDALEEGDEELLVVADLAVYVGGFAADVGEVEDDVVEGGAGEGWSEFGSVDVVDEFGFGLFSLL